MTWFSWALLGFNVVTGVCWLVAFIQRRRVSKRQKLLDQLAALDVWLGVAFRTAVIKSDGKVAVLVREEWRQ